MELPHLQIVCSKLFEAVHAASAKLIDLSMYEHLGRASGILRGYLNCMLARLPSRSSVIAKSVFVELVSSEATKRTLSYNMLASRIEARPIDLDDTLTLLVNARLLRRDEIEGEIVYEMAHEYLIAEIGQWITTSDQTFKQVEELLAREVTNWRIHHTLIPRDRLELIYAQRTRLGRVDDATGECLLRSALQSDFEVEEWMRCIAVTNIQPLYVLLQDVSPGLASTKGRRKAARALGIANDTRAVAPLIAALKDADREVRRGAAEALGQLGDAAAVAPLIAALRDPDWELLSVAARSLGQLGDAAVVPLIAALKDTDREVRVGAAEALGQLSDAAAVAPLIAALKDPDWGVCRGAARSLGQLGDAVAVVPLIAALKDENGEVRTGAVTALKAVGTPEVLAALDNPVGIP